jgi:hypothetical protein
VDGDEYNLVEVLGAGFDLGADLGMDLLIEGADDLKEDPPTLPPLLAAIAASGLNNVVKNTDPIAIISIDFY